MSVHKVTEPKITKVLKSITVQVCQVEGYVLPIVIVNNPEQVPTDEVIAMLEHSAHMLKQFIKEQN